ncbi:MAG: IPT/TIG domain-containing protein, partial [Streptosporangiaceae bacterium]
MPQGSQNYELVGTNCQNIQGLTVILDVSEKLVTSQNGGFSLQLNTLPPPGVTSVGLTLNWIQFTLYVGGPYNNEASFQWQAWANGATTWPPGYIPPPGSTNPNQPVPPFPQPNAVITPVPSNQLLEGSSLTIALTTDPSPPYGVTAATFTVQLADLPAQSVPLPFPPYAQFPIAAFEVDLVGPGQLSTATFTSGAGQLTYSVSAPEVCAQPPGTTGACAFQYYETGEKSNASYGPIIPNCGSGGWEYPSLQTQQITSIPPPVISSIDPSTGSTIGGTQVLIQGSYLDGATAVLFGGTPGTGVSTLAGDTIEAISPPASAGPVDIIVDANVQSSSPSPAAVFTYIYEPGVTGITVNPDILWTGQSATGTVTLNELAPPGGTTVELLVSGIEEASFVTAPATVLVPPVGAPAGDTSATFTITTSATAWGAATITAGGPDGNALSTAVEISAGQIVLALPLPAGYLLIGQTATGTISVRTPAPASGGLI